MKKIIFIAILISTVMTSYAAVITPSPTASKTVIPIQASVGMGYVGYRDAYKNDGNTIAGRVALGVIPFHWQKADLGVEVGVQSGNRMRLDESQDVLDQLGGLPIQTTIKPIADLLATLHVGLDKVGKVFVLIKGGIAYRRWQFDRDTISSLDKVNGEVQAGLGVKISPRTNLVAYYQGIYGGSVRFKVRNGTAGDATGSVNNIPTQHGGFVGIEINV